jgi:uncharacterized protein (TIGR03083 family)
MRGHGIKDFWLATLRAEGPVIARTLAEADPAAPVPSCPQWTVAELTGHLVRFYTWVGAHVGRGVVTPPEHPEPTGPRTATPAEYETAFAELLTLFDVLDPEMPAWNPDPQAKRVAYWQRRVAHDTAIHRWDAQMATVGLTEPLEAKLAADIVSEALDTLLPGGHGRRPADRHGTVALSATDLGHTWHIRLRASGGVALLDTDTLLDDDDLHERVIAAGPASDLALALWGRVGFDVLAVDGDEQLLECLRVG